MQLALLGVSGVLYLSSHYKNPSVATHIHSQRQDGISQLQSVLANNAAYFAVAVIASCLVRLCQGPTIYELGIISRLCLFQGYLHILHVLARYSMLPDRSRHRTGGQQTKGQHFRLVALHLSFLLVDSTLLVAFFGKFPDTSSGSEKPSRMILEILQHCNKSEAARKMLANLRWENKYGTQGIVGQLLLPCFFSLETI